MLVVSVQDYLHRSLVRLVHHLYGEDTPVISMRAWRQIDRRFLVKLLFYSMPFRIKRIFTPSDLGGRLVRLLLDMAALFDIETYVVPAHNHPLHLDSPLPLHLRYVDLKHPRVVGGFSKRTRLIVNDNAMRAFFLAMHYDPRRLVLVEDWIGQIYRREVPSQYRLVFFTEVMQEIEARQFQLNLLRVKRLLEEKLIEKLYVKLHPREPAAAVNLYRSEFGRFDNVEFIENADSFDVINRSDIVMASFSTCLLEALWLGKKILILDNGMYRGTMLSFYLNAENHLLYTEQVETEEVRRYCANA